MSLDWAELRRRIDRAFAGALGESRPSGAAVDALLDERARRLAAPAQEPTAAADELELVVFRLGEQRYALESRHVRGIVGLTECVPVPGLPGHFTGVASVRGDILAIVDLRSLLQLPPAASGRRGDALIVGDRDGELGIVADVVDEVVRLAAGAIGRAPVADTSAELVHGVTADGLTVLDGAALLGDPRFVVDFREDERLPRRDLARS